MEKSSYVHRWALSCLLMLTSATVSWAYDFVVDDIYYEISDNNAVVTSGTDKYSGDVLIPESVTYNGTTYSVTSRGDYAFADCFGLTSAILPNSITSIGECTYRGMSL